MLNRRLFVSTVAGTAAVMTTSKAATLFPEKPVAKFSQPWNQPLFKQLQGDYVFLQDAQGQVFEARLANVSDMGSNAEIEQFAVGFAPSDSASLPEGLYQLSHRTAGCCELYLSASEHSCTALFSLLR